ncbi:MAG: hypothetical protein P8J33_01205 [Pirellulaceae bacterium]|nr:hypothetical protein [Pirellulaceae bacterium]
MRFFCLACVFGILVAAASFFIDFRNASPDSHPAKQVAAPLVSDQPMERLQTDGGPNNGLQITSTGN